MKMNSEYFVALARTFEERYGVQFAGIREGPVSDPRERLIQFKTNIDVVMSVLERNGLGDWLADRLAALGDTVKDDGSRVRVEVAHDPFLDERLRVANLPVEPQKSDGEQSSLGSTEANRHHAFPQARRRWPGRAAECRKSSNG